MSRTGTSTSDKTDKSSKSSKANRTDRATIVGVGETRYARWGRIGDVTEHALACEAILRAVADAGLDSLANNGGPTLTHALLAGSPAIDAADNAVCPATDQRGVARPQGPGCDIGAFELEGAP